MGWNSFESMRDGVNKLSIGRYNGLLSIAVYYIYDYIYYMTTIIILPYVFQFRFFLLTYFTPIY